jgi:hypothetical protein
LTSEAKAAQQLQAVLQMLDKLGYEEKTNGKPTIIEYYINKFYEFIDCFFIECADGSLLAADINKKIKIG